MASIDSLIDDVYKLFDPNKIHVPSEDNLEVFANNLKNILRNRLGGRENIADPLRFSSLGKGDKQLWYMAQGEDKEEMRAQTFYKFLYGDVIEELMLFLVKESGHDVSREQEEVEVDGVKGHIDAVIDGVVVDVKSASPFGYKKFKDATIFEDDPFGYIPQISGYADCLKSPAAFLAFDKVSGDICLLKVPASIIGDNKPEPRIKHLKEVINNPIPPARCYTDKEDGRSGNRKLGTECSYCAFKSKCWPNLRTFIYSSGPRYLTVVAREPDVYEVK